MSLTRKDMIGMIADRVWHAIISYRPTIKGRATRAEMVGTFVACVAAQIAFSIILIIPDQAAADGRQLGDADILIRSCLFILIFLPFGAAAIRRLHDTGRNAWSLCVAFFPYLGWLILLGILFWDGEEYENAFGKPHGWD